MTLYDIVQRTLITMLWLKEELMKPQPPRPSRSALDVDPGDECDCGMCLSRRDLEALNRSLAEGNY